MIYGYARVSTTDQGLAQQVAQLTDAGWVKIYREKISGATAECPQLKRAIGVLDDGDGNRPPCPQYPRSIEYPPCGEGGRGWLPIIAEPMVDITSQFAKVIVAVLGIAASWERERITERTAAGRVQELTLTDNLLQAL